MFFAFTHSASAATYSWQGTTNTNWAVSTNWSPNGVPDAGDTVTISNKTNNPILDQSRSIGVFTMTSGILDLGTYTLTATSTSTFTAGTINNGTMAVNTGITTVATFTATTFGSSVSVASGRILLNGSTFNGTTNSFTKTSIATADTSTGGNTFGSGSTSTFTNTGDQVWYLSSTSNNTFNGDIKFENTSTGSIYLTSATSLSTLADGKTILIGPAGFTGGNLYLSYFTQTGTTAQALTLTGNAIVYLTIGTTFNGNLTVSAPDIVDTGATFNGITNFTRTGLAAASTNGDMANGVSAGVVIGQRDFVHNLVNQGLNAPTAYTFSNVRGPYFDGSKLFVSDYTNHRVLIYNSIPTTNGASADVVIGQPNMTSNTANNGGIGANTFNQPATVYSDGVKLFIADRTNNRVLIYNSIPTTNGASADVVIGQPNMTSSTANNGGIGANTLNNPNGVYSDGSKLFIADRANSRVLIYNTIPTTNGASADVVIGQPDMTSSTANNGGIGANTLSVALGVYYDGQKLFIIDFNNNRVLIYNSIPTTNGASADVVIGQPDFFSSTANNGGIGANTINQPATIFSDGVRLFITDFNNNRTLIYNTIPVINNASADVVIGQPDMTSNTLNNGGLGANTLFNPNGAYSDGKKLFVGDYSNSRVLIYNFIHAPTNFTSTVQTSGSVSLSVDSFTNSALIANKYYFSRSDGTNSGWLTTNTWQDTTVASNTSYIYSVQYGTGDGITSATTTASAVYTLASTPTNLSASSNKESITLYVDSFPNATSGSSGYYFSRSGANSGWIQARTWQDTGLTCGNSYDYSVKYRNGDGVETSSIFLTKSTDGCGGGGLPPVAYQAPISPIGGFKILINPSSPAGSSGLSANAGTTNSPTVTLSLTAGTDIKNMAISNFSDFRDASQESYQPTKQWDLCQQRTTCPAGQYTVYAKFYTQYGQVSETVQDSINKTTDATAPITQTTPTMSADQRVVLIAQIKQQLISLISQLIQMLYLEVEQMRR
ncbi:MAG: hypothetical protein Q8O66_00755 [bacterium]|nr:hypothetical protein [bacterium]